VSRRRKRAKPPREVTLQHPAAAEADARRPRLGGRGPRRAALLAIVAAVVVAAAVSGFVLLARSGESTPRALIVDQLDQTFPNPAFVKEAGTLLTDAGYHVYYTPGKRATVDFYRDLGRGDYDVIVLRTHVARLLDATRQNLGDDAILFTSEPYTATRYLKDQLAWRLGPAYYYPGGDQYFGLLPEFITSNVRGDFNGATVIVMGCDGLKSNKMAEAFVRKGAQAFISWDGDVSADHTDAATERLLQHLVVDKLGTQEAVARTMTEVGPDPSYGSKLVLYPAEAAVSAVR